MSGLDWPGLMRAGLGALRLRPAEFWDLTPAELRVLLGQDALGAPLLRAGLDGLMRDWPDQEREASDDGLPGRD